MAQPRDKPVEILLRPEILAYLQTQADIIRTPEYAAKVKDWANQIAACDEENALNEALAVLASETEGWV